MAQDRIRLAFFHTELSRDGPGLLLRDILSGEDEQVLAVSEVVREVEPDILVLAGIDWDLEGHALAALVDAIGGFRHSFSNRPNRGIQSGRDLNDDVILATPDDAFGWAEFPGQNGMAVLSRLPLAKDKMRDFTELPWLVLKDALAPEGTDDQARLSSTVHWDLPVVLPSGDRLHLLIWHATPPVFDGPEDRNGRRNHDEAAFWLECLDGAFGDAPDRFVLMGAANLDPADGDGRPQALNRLLRHPLVTDPKPSSNGGVWKSREDGGTNLRHGGNPTLDTVDWPDGEGRPGNLRVDFVLPSSNLRVVGSGVLWPENDTSLRRNVETASRHRLVWVDIELVSE